MMSSNFKLLITTDTSSEIWNYTIKLCEAVSFYVKADILLVSFGGSPNKLQEEEAKALNIQVMYTDYFPKNSDQNALKNAEEYLVKVIDEFNPNIAQLNHYLSISDRVECPIVITGHGDLISLLKWTKTNSIENIDQYRYSVKKAVNSADTVILTSRFAVECLFKEYDFNNKFRVIYNGINIEPTGILPEIPCILAEGNLNDRSKNLNLLTKIADKIPDSIKICVIGSNNYNRTSKRIEWISNLSFEEKIEKYRKSSIFLALSSYEQFGFPSIISAYSNCAILANDIPVYRELWGDCACIYERNNLNSFIRHLNNLIENKKLLTFTAKNCQAKALSSFSIKRMGLEYINLYKSILHKYIASNKNLKIANKTEVK
ncbi:MAG: glycosyltransferase [Candidatus Gastranaerophilales bacterium]|nr:glycosyltransferase [Candidatus Gastranaerophilales bacterium]